MFESISYYQILGWSLVIYLGVAAVVLFLVTAVFVVLPMKKPAVRVRWHRWLAIIALIIGRIHAFLGISAYF